MASPRSASEKKLVNTVIDAEVAAKELATKASQFGASLGQRLTNVARVLSNARVTGQITAEQVKNAFREAYLALTLAGFVEVAQEIADHSSQVAADVKTHAAAMGGELPATSPIRKADFVAREIERKSNGS